MPNILDEGNWLVQDQNLSTSRWQVRSGIAAYFGGTYVANMRAYQGGALSGTYGLGTVRAGYPKELNMRDAFAGSAAGRMSGALMIVEVGNDSEVRQANAGQALSTNGTITAGGIKQVTYPINLDCYHISQEAYAEDAQQDVDHLIEAVKQLIRLDRTLGGICMDAGETRAGIKTLMRHSGQDDKKRTLTSFSVAFEVRTNFIA